MEDIFLFFMLASIAGVVYYRNNDHKKRNTLIIVAIISFILFGVADDLEADNELMNETQTEKGEEQEHQREKVEELKEENDFVKTNEDDMKEEQLEVFNFDEEIFNDKEYDITLDKIERLEETTLEAEQIKATFEIKNKTDRKIEVQARTVSIDNHMVNDSLIWMSQEIAAGKTATTTMSIHDYAKETELPNLEGTFEMVLHFFEWDDMDYRKEIDVSVELD